MNEKYLPSVIKFLVEKIIFSSKWLLIPFYLYLFWILTKLMYYFMSQGHLNNQQLMSTLEAVDIVMIANLVKMIITGSYHSFVSKNHIQDSEKVSSGLLKVKMATSVIGVTMVHLLQTFISVETIEWVIIYKQTFIHGVFLIGALILAYINYLHEKIEHE